jgi:glycine betaine/proline transport system ATP-binding protein
MQEAFLMGNRIAIMESGRILQIGTPDEIRKNPATDFVADFFRGVM